MPTNWTGVDYRSRGNFWENNKELHFLRIIHLPWKKFIVGRHNVHFCEKSLQIKFWPIFSYKSCILDCGLKVRRKKNEFLGSTNNNANTKTQKCKYKWKSACIAPLWWRGGCQFPGGASYKRGGGGGCHRFSIIFIILIGAVYNILCNLRLYTMCGCYLYKYKHVCPLHLSQRESSFSWSCFHLWNLDVCHHLVIQI